MPDKLRTLISAEDIARRVAEMAHEIDSAYGDNQSAYLISVLKGSFVFLADLVRAMKRNVRIEFMAISSYGHGKTTSGEVNVTRDLGFSIEGQDVLGVEDIIDSGVTLNYLLRLLEQRSPNSVQIATLLDKPDRRIRPVKVDFLGFSIPDAFVVGYGLDYAEDTAICPTSACSRNEIAGKVEPVASIFIRLLARRAHRVLSSIAGLAKAPHLTYS
jgi:hypoxanthine phosphoribosyltransferase